MFDTTIKANCTWSHLVSGRGKRTVETKLGFYVVEHISTGKCLVGYSKTVSRDVDEQIAHLMRSAHPNRAMNKLVSMDMELKLFEYPTVSLAAAKDAVRSLKKTVDPTYLLLNP